MSVTLGEPQNNALKWLYNQSRSGCFINSNEIVKSTHDIPLKGPFIKIYTAYGIESLDVNIFQSQTACNFILLDSTGVVRSDERDKGFVTRNYTNLGPGTYYLYGENFKETGDFEYVFFRSLVIDYKYRKM